MADYATLIRPTGSRQQGDKRLSDDPQRPDDQYLQLLEFLYDRYVRPHASTISDRFHHHMGDEWSYELTRAIRAARMLRFIETCSDTPSDVYSTFTLEGLRRTFYDVHYSSEFAERIVRDGGFLDAYEADPNGLLADIRPEYLPDIDKEVLRRIGSSNPDAELRVLMRNAKTILHHTGMNDRDRPISQQLKQVYECTERAAKDVDAEIEESKVESPKEKPKKSRRWYKGLGQIGQGAALTIANAALAFGAIHVPVSPETQTWGTLVSVVTGIGTMLSGVGDLRNE
jgi:hypothetical protein